MLEFVANLGSGPLSFAARRRRTPPRQAATEGSRGEAERTAAPASSGRREARCKTPSSPGTRATAIFASSSWRQVSQNIGQKEALLKSLDLMWRDANAPAYLIHASRRPENRRQAGRRLLPAQADLRPLRHQAAARWLDAAKKPLWEVPAGVVPDDISTQGWFFADDKNFYLAFRCNDKLYPRRPARRCSSRPTRKGRQRSSLLLAAMVPGHQPRRQARQASTPSI